MTSFVDNFFISSITSMISKTTSAPVELWRIQRQNSFIPHSSLRAVLKKEGLRYLWKGNGVNLAKGIPQYSLNYALFREFNDTIDNRLISGVISGSCSIGVIYPLETTRTFLSLQTNKNKYNGIFDVIKKNKYNNLYRGFSMSLFGFGTFSGLLFSFQNSINEKYPKLAPISGGIASIGALTITYPTDLIRRRMQLQNFDKAVPHYKSYGDLFKKVYKNEGIQGFYRGLFPNYCKSFVQWSVHFYILNLLETHLKSKRSS